MRTDGDRLKSSLIEMSRIGATSAGGVTRLALSDEDRQARDLFAAWCRGAGLKVRVDDLGNQYARLEGADPTAAPVVTGSHLDTVPLGGRYDGALGVMLSLEVARTLVDSGTRTRRPIEVVNFTNEEGARFEPALLASGALAGRFATDFVYSRTDRDGKSFGAELERIGYKGSPEARLKAIHACVEAHIEQGPFLEEQGLPLASVSGILARVRWDVTFAGQPQHAGPSPMRRRRDAMVAAARAIAALRDLALKYPDPVTATVGRLQAVPGVFNQIPGHVTIGVDMRHPTVDGHDEMLARAEELLRQIAAEERVEVSIETISKGAPMEFDQRLTELIESKVRELGLECPRLVSCAGQDAQFMVQMAPTAMLFVRTIGGMSHCESEAILYEDANLAADVLLNTIVSLAQ